MTTNVVYSLLTNHLILFQLKLKRTGSYSCSPHLGFCRASPVCHSQSKALAVCCPQTDYSAESIRKLASHLSGVCWPLMQACLEGKHCCKMSGEPLSMGLPVCQCWEREGELERPFCVAWSTLSSNPCLAAPGRQRWERKERRMASLSWATEVFPIQGFGLKIAL